MAKNETRELRKLLKAFPKELQERALWIREFIWDLYPSTNELIYDNYNALAIGWSLTERQSHIFCSLALGRSSYNLHFGFYWGAQLTDSRGLLLGQGNQYRYLLVPTKKDFPAAYVKKLMKEAYANSLKKVKDEKELCKGLTLLKSVSEKKRPPKEALL